MIHSHGLVNYDVQNFSVDDIHFILLIRNIWSTSVTDDHHDGLIEKTISGRSWYHLLSGRPTLYESETMENER